MFTKKFCFSAYLRQWLPLSCFICHQSSSTTLCAQCYANLTVAPIHCCCCLQVLQEENAMCGRCLRENPFLDGLYASMKFDDFSRRIILQGKYANDRVALDWMGQAIAALALPTVDEIVPMPIASKRLAHRGFNQTHFLTRPVKTKWHYPVNRYLLMKQDRIPQSKMAKKFRAENIRGAFVVNQKPPARLLLIDDVATTGATLYEAAKVLKKAGAQKVYAAVFAGVFQ